MLNHLISVKSRGPAELLWDSATCRRVPKRGHARALPKILVALLCCCLLLAASCLPAAAQNYTLDRHVVAGGGGTVSAGPYTFSGTIGQADANPTTTSGPYALTGGFWRPFAANVGSVQPQPIPTPPGLVAWWPANNNAVDVVGGNNGTLTNGVTYVPGEVQQAFNFNSDSAMVLLANSPALQLQNFTIESWIKRGNASNATSDPTPAGEGSAILFGYGNNGYAFGVESSQYNNELVLTKVGVSGVLSSVSISDTNWHHVAVTTANGNVVFYVDGVAYPYGNYNPGYTFATAPAIGGKASNLNQPNNNSFFGSIDELSVYNQALSAAQILAIYDSGSAGKYQPSSPVTLPGVPIVVWTNTAGGNWSVAANWSPNQVPTGAEIAMITNEATFTVTVDVTASVDGLVLGASSGANVQTLQANGQTLQIEGPAIVSPQGQLTLTNCILAGATELTGALTLFGGQLLDSGSLTVAGAGVLNLEGSSSYNFVLQGPLTNNGTVNWQGGSLQIANYGSTTPYGGIWYGAIWNYGQWNIECSGLPVQGYFDSAYEIFHNAGTLTKSGVAGTTEFGVYVDNNGGTVQAEVGQIGLTSGQYSLANGILDFWVNTSNNFGSINLPGTAPLAGAVTVTFGPAYVPHIGNAFALATYGSYTGEFSALNLPNSVTWTTNYGATAFTLAIANLNPVQPTQPLLQSVQLSGGTLTFTFQSVNAQNYTVQTTTNLNAPKWVSLGTVTGTGASLPVSVPVNNTIPEQFYRLSVP